MKVRSLEVKWVSRLLYFIGKVCLELLFAEVCVEIYITDMLYIWDSPDHKLFDFMHNTESLLPFIINCGNKINCMHTLKP